eukprot:g6853.t1
MAWIVINALMGNKLNGVETGLDAAIKRCNKESDVKKGLSPDMLHSLLAFLAVLSKEIGNTDGSYLVASTPGPVNEAWLEKIQNQNQGGKTMVKPTLCNTANLQAGNCGMHDFMAGGTPAQALTDIAGMDPPQTLLRDICHCYAPSARLQKPKMHKLQDVGGGAQLCRVANSQDESLVIFYPEVLAASFFVGDGQMLPVPFTMLGARRYLSSIRGETGVGAPYDNQCGKVQVPQFLNSKIMENTVDTHVSITPVKISKSAFVAVASYCSDCHRGECSEPEMFNNQCDNQRKHLDEEQSETNPSGCELQQVDVSAWLQAYDHTNYHDAISTAFAAVVSRVGTGPWGAGLWQGDAQQYFLTVWLATSLLENVQLDYYVYDHFCENAGHQCFVLSGDLCRTCISDSGMQNVINSQYCGNMGAQGRKKDRGTQVIGSPLLSQDTETRLPRTAAEMVDRLSHQPVANVYWLVKNVGPPPHQVFDLIGNSVQKK